MTNSSSSIGDQRRSSAFASPDIVKPRPVRSHSLDSDQKTETVFNCIREVHNGSGVEQAPGSPFRPINQKRPTNPHVPVRHLINRLPEDKPRFLVRLEKLLDLFLSQEKEAIENGIDGFFKGNNTFNEEVEPTESSFQEVFQMRQDKLVSFSNIFELSKRMIEARKNKLIVLDEIDREIGSVENQEIIAKIKGYADELKQYSVGYAHPAIQDFIEEQKEIYPTSLSILALERANIENGKVNEVYNFLRVILQPLF